LSTFKVRTSDASTRQGISRRWPFKTTEWDNIQKLAKRTADDDELDIIVEQTWQEILAHSRKWMAEGATKKSVPEERAPVAPPMPEKPESRCVNLGQVSERPSKQSGQS
jgi:hypothetical protein